MILNITNGDYLNDKLSKENEGEFFPFREAMVQGDALCPILDANFIKLRAKSLGVSEELYKEKAKELLEFSLRHEKYSKLKLWFGADTFCQLNLLTLLAFLEQINYAGEIELAIIDDETGNTLKPSSSVKLGQYLAVYKTVLISKQMPDELGVINRRAIELYFDYLSLDGYLARLIKENRDLTENQLLVLLLESSKEYGLSDLNLKELILRVKI